MKHSQSNIQIDDIILQLRQMINESSNRKTLASYNQQTPIPSSTLKSKPANMDSLIEQSSKLIHHKKTISTQNSQVRNKILAASELLKDENPLIVSYVKQKIQSELFASQLVPQLNKPQMFRLQEEKQALALQKKQELQKQAQRRRQLVTSIKEFESNSRVRVDVHEIDNLIFQQEPESSYLFSSQKNDVRKVSSKSNQVKNSNLYISQVYQMQEEEKVLNQSKNQLADASRLQEEDLEYTEVAEEVESHFMIQSEKADPATEGLRKILEKYPHVVKVFYQFLKNQFHIMHAKNALTLIADIFSEQVDHIRDNIQSPSSPSIPQNHLWKNLKKKFSKASRRPAQKITDITQKYKFKAFAIIEENKVLFDRKKVSERRINKMIGDSKNFHPKKCILTKNQLFYFQEKETSDENKFLELAIPQNTKSIEVELQRINSLKFVKQEGSFFSKKQIDTDLIVLKGKPRPLKFENNFLEGAELVKDLKKLMASKVYAICSTFNGLNNISFFDFINNDSSSEFNFSSEFIPAQQNFTIKDNRDLYIKIICELFAEHKEFTHFSLQQSKLLSPQISDFAREFRKMEKLKVINLSHLRLTKQNFQEICQCVNDIQTSKGQIEINLSDCRIDDDCFISNVGVFTSFCSKVKKLDISDNFITAKSVQIIKVCLENINTEITHLNISNCPIRELGKLNGLIKESRKLQVLEGENISLGFEEKTVQEVTRFFDFIKKCNPNIKKINLAKNGGLNQEKYSYLQNGWNVSTIEELIVDLSMKERLDKGKKELKRTDNVAGQKTILLMRPVFKH